MTSSSNTGSGGAARRFQVEVRSATEPFDTSTPAGRMPVQMLGVFAEFEREMIIDRVINGMERKASKGKWTLGQVPYGFARESDDALAPIEDEIEVGDVSAAAPWPRISTNAACGAAALAAGPAPNPVHSRGATKPSPTYSPTASTSARSASAGSSPSTPTRR
jgi:hypothetical protein